ncbi:protocadherin Fat 4 isoform X2 [Oryzias melastigma]|uniref:protocadherin Fat 4 isoform X2 n=1 Tax=Oryzias melastigma TaxID=30732 RepID=UPI000CF827FC|nr:protocadherin Fat 4 isoform X2 [Oryzias melastigma]
MEHGGLLCVCLLSVCVYAVAGEPIGTTVINCATQPEVINLTPVDEGYEGDVELITGIPGGTNVLLVPYAFPEHLEYVEMIFTLGDTTAMIRTKKTLDADALKGTDRVLYYSIKCDDLFGYENSRKLQLNDLNDNSPVFAERLYTTEISETLSVDTEVVRVKAEDADSSPANSQLTYSFTPPSEYFIVEGTGAFILKKRLNYNEAQTFTFTLTAQDFGGKSDTTTVVFNVIDSDNQNPYFTHSLYQAAIQENENGVFTDILPEAIQAQDGDMGINMAVTYSISTVSPNAYERNFNIDPNTGVLSVVTAFDREEMSSTIVSVSIKAAQTDDPLKTADAVVSITVQDVNDNAPTFETADYTETLLENSPANAVVFKAIITDLDEGGFVGTLRILPESAPFSIDPDGTVRVKDSAALDRETTQNFEFQIEATERDAPNHVTTAQVTLTLIDENDNSPTFSQTMYVGEVFADQEVGMQLVQVEANDPDDHINGEIKFSIEFGNDAGYFLLDEDTGVITLANTIPFEENMILEFPLYITATDRGIVPRTSAAQVVIRAPGNSNPQFLQEVFTGVVEEEQEPGAFITKVSFLKLPGDETPVTLQVTSEGDKFSISNDGELTTTVKLDFDEGLHEYSVRISITDGTNTDNAVVEVSVTDINDNSPVFTSESVTEVVPENAEVPLDITAVAATDKDDSFNKEIRYSLRGGDAKFSIDPLSGMVSLVGGLDREITAQYSVLVLAEDQGHPVKSATATLTIQVSDINDNTPKFSQDAYRVEVLETEAVDFTLLTLSAEDPDEGVNGIISYSISEQSPSSDPATFALDATSGVLRLVQPLDYSEVKEYTLKIQASDGGTPSMVGSASVVVVVKDVNNKPPEFNQEMYEVSVYENLASGASILLLEVTDRDEGGFSNGNFLVSPSDTFEINKQGLVSLKKDVTLDRETTDKYNLEVVAVDQPTEGLRATAQVEITILDYNDNTPQFPSIPDPLEISEGSYTEEAPGEILAIVPTDADLGPNAEVTLSLATPHPLFQIREDGMLLAVANLDRETTEIYELFVKASDNGSPQRENIKSIRVQLLDVNDNKPEFSLSSYVSSILLKDATEGVMVLKLSATDPDFGDNALITYSFSEGSSKYLALNSETGEVTLTSEVTALTEDTVVEMTAMATDHGEPPLHSTAGVEVNLRLASMIDNVAFLKTSYNFSLSENQPEGTTVGQVLASSGSNLYNVSYALKTHGELFSISSDGSILTLAELDKEQEEWYILDVEAVDTRTPPTSAMTTVRVQVEDVNEPPQFPDDVYEASVFNIAPYKTPVIQVKASDPDVGEQAELVYSLTDSSSFDIDRASGLVYVVSAVGQDGDTTELEVKATDPRGLSSTTKVKVQVHGDASSSDVVIISLNQPANIVENKISELESALGKVLQWTVTIIQVTSSNGGTADSRALRNSVRTLVSLVALADEDVVSSEEVRKKLRSESAAVTTELSSVFGAGVQFELVSNSQSASPDMSIVIALGVLLGVFGVLVIVLGVLFARSKTKMHRDDDKVSFDMEQRDQDYTNKDRKDSAGSWKRRDSNTDSRKNSMRSTLAF